MKFLGPAAKASLGGGMRPDCNRRRLADVAAGPARPGQSAPGIAANAGGTRAGFAELVTGADRKPLALNRLVATGGQPQEILLGGMHRMVMNRHTKATFFASAGTGPAAPVAAAAPAMTGASATPSSGGATGDGGASNTPQRGQDGQDGQDGQSGQDGQGGQGGKVPYEIQLAQGELYVEVVPGHPFTVRTANARLDITGTKFDVLADGDKTELTLLKGSVRFTRPADGGAAGAAEAFVDVPVGHASAVIGRRAPTPPRQADALAATAWARGLALTNAVAAADPDADLHLLDSVRESWPQSRPVDLASIDYVKWRDDHRDWFAREFPWIFKAHKALKDGHGIDADYIELLMVSGDILQFNYPRAIDRPIPIFNAVVVNQIAIHYGIDPARLLEAISADCLLTADKPEDQTAASCLTAESLAESAKGHRTALQRWHVDIAGLSKTTEAGARIGSPADNTSANSQNDVLLFTLRAGAYLKNTRTAAWVWSRNSPDKATALFTAWRNWGLLPLRAETSAAYQRCMDRLINDAITAESISQLVQELLTTPQLTGYDCEATTLTEQLSNKVSNLQMPKESE